MRLQAKGFSPPNRGRHFMCFDGRQDELVVAASKDNNLHVWSLPESQGLDLTINQSLNILRGHSGKVFCVRYNPCNDILASAGAEKIVKIWTPIAQ